MKNTSLRREKVLDVALCSTFQGQGIVNVPPKRDLLRQNGGFIEKRDMFPVAREKYGSLEVFMTASQSKRQSGAEPCLAERDVFSPP